MINQGGGIRHGPIVSSNNAQVWNHLSSVMAKRDLDIQKKKGKSMKKKSQSQPQPRQKATEHLDEVNSQGPTLTRL